jgi:hypothetical protein
MSQPPTVSARNVLLALLPPVLLDMVLYQLPLANLVTCFFISHKWQDAMDNDDVLRAKMFRLPKYLEDADESARAVFVAKLWGEMYKKMNKNERSPGVNWQHICANPLLSPTVNRWRFYDYPPRGFIRDTYGLRGPVLYAYDNGLEEHAMTLPPGRKIRRRL